MKNVIVIVIVIVIIIGGIWYFTSTKRSNYVVPTTPAPEISQPAPEEQSSSLLIIATDAGFSPSSLAVTAGETVTFKNESSQPSWPASAIHPTHTVYPGSSIAKCATAEEGGIFDACKGLLKGETWSFKFDIPGTWKYHDHLNVSHYGTIIVE